MQLSASSQLLRGAAMIALLRKGQPVETCRIIPARTPIKIVEEDYSPASLRSLFRVGLCLSCLSLRFLPAGSVRVGGGVPIAWRAAAFTADAARKGFGLRILEGITTSLRRFSAPLKNQRNRFAAAEQHSNSSENLYTLW